MKTYIFLVAFLFSSTLGFSQAQLDDGPTPKSHKKHKDKSYNDSYKPYNNSESNKSEKLFDFDFGFGGGIFLSNSSAVKDIYGEILPTGNINLTFWLKNFSFRIDVYGIYKKGKPISNEFYSKSDANCRLLMFPATLSILYRFKYKNSFFNYFYPYIGIGAGISTINESLKISTLEYSSSVTKAPLDIAAIVGFKVKFISLEARYSRTMIDASSGAGGENCNVGGISVVLGFRW